jgi:hypothetical protein
MLISKVNIEGDFREGISAIISNKKYLNHNLRTNQNQALVMVGVMGIV